MNYKDNVLVAIISGGRPLPSQRQTEQFVDDNAIIISNNSKNYESRLKIIDVPTEFTVNYRKSHQLLDVGFDGAYISRQYSKVYAKEHGYKYVLQLDDNIVSLGYTLPKSTQQFKTLQPIEELFYEVAESTNGTMIGAELMSLSFGNTFKLATRRNYSCFLEDVNNGVDWYGPFDDDVLHNHQINAKKNQETIQCISVAYGKEAKSNSGMRKAYDKYSNLRPLAVAKLFPSFVSVGYIQKKTTGVHKSYRYYHKLKRMKSHIIITDNKRLRKAVKIFIHKAYDPKFTKEHRKNTHH